MTDVNERVDQLLVRIKTDKQAAADTLSALDAVKEAQESLVKATESGSGSAQIAAIRQQSDAQFQLAQAIDEVAAATQKATQMTEEEAAAFENVFDASLKAADAQKEASSGSGPGIGAFRPAAQAIGAIAGPSAAEPIRLIGEASRLIDDFGGNVADVGKAALVASPLLIAAGIAIKLYSDQTKAEEDAIQAVITAHEAYVKAIQQQTTEQIQTQIAQLEANRRYLTTLRDDTVQALQNTDFSQGFLLPLSKSFTDLIAKAGDYNTQLGDNQAQIDALTSALGTSDVAANDAAVAEKKLADARAQTALASGQNTQSGFLEDQQLLRGNVDQTRAALQKYSDQLGANAAEISDLIASGDQSAEVQAQIKKLIDDNTEAQSRYTDILTNVLPTVQANAEAEFQLEAARKGVLALSGEMVTAEQANAQAQQQLTSAQKAYTDGLAKAKDSLSTALNAALSTEQAAITNANQQAASARLDAEQQSNDALVDAELKANEARADAQRNFRETIARIDRTFNQAATSAIANRDAVALAQARQTKQNETRDAKQARDNQLRNIDRSLRDEQRLIDRRYKEQLQKIDAALAKQVADAQAKYQQAVAVAQQSYQQQETNLKNALDAQQAIADTAHAKMLAAEQAFWDAAQAQVPTASGATNYTPPSFAPGGTPPLNKLVRINDPGPESALMGRSLAVFGTPNTRIFDASATRSILSGASGGTHYHVHLDGVEIQGVNKQQMIREVTRYIERSFETFVEGQDNAY